MKTRQTVLTLIMVGGLSAFSLIQPTEAQAWYWTSWGFHHGGHNQHNRSHNKHKKYYKYSRHSRYYKYNRHHHYPYGSVVFGLPNGHISISVGGSNYHYHNGHYYQKRRHNRYVVIEAPIGACIARLPYGHETVYIDGRRYYTYDDVYYKHTPDGYEVVHDPHNDYYAKKGKKRGYTNYKNDTFIINIPTPDGGYMPVTLTRKGDGFIGPQGEYYDEFPKIAQLKVMYGSQ